MTFLTASRYLFGCFSNANERLHSFYGLEGRRHLYRTALRFSAAIKGYNDLWGECHGAIDSADLQNATRAQRVVCRSMLSCAPGLTCFPFDSSATTIEAVFLRIRRLLEYVSNQYATADFLAKYWNECDMCNAQSMWRVGRRRLLSFVALCKDQADVLGSVSDWASWLCLGRFGADV
jgi:hypothetical protein